MSAGRREGGNEGRRFKMKRNHRNLKAWQLGIDLVERVYATTSDFPREELFGLAAQMRRAAVSVPSNIAEGFARPGTKELVRFIGIAAASLSELDTHVEIARRLGYLKDGVLAEQIDEVSGILMGLDASLKRRLRA
jgi:four helix bundle protein